MRTLLASALVLLACGVAGGCADRSSRPSGAGAPPSIPGGPDPIVLRVSRDGGLMTAARYPALDTIIWRSAAKVPPLSRVIAFGAEDGYLAAIDTGGAPVRIDVRLGTVTRLDSETVRQVSSADGGAIFALTQTGEIVRYTPSGGDWRLTPPVPAHAMAAQPDGSLIVAGAQGDRALVWRVRPPNMTISDSVGFNVGGDSLALASAIATTTGAVGDRMYFGGNEIVAAVRTRDLGRALQLEMDDPIRAIAATPSGDRFFVALDGDDALRIVDRFEESETGKIRLPGSARELRMDPLGRSLLVRGAGDSVFVVSLATDKTLGVVRTAWRGDLPLVLPDGAIATTRGDDVVIVHPSTLSDMRTVTGGARQFWHTVRWNGFRPRAAGLDQPVKFRTSAPRDSMDDSLPPDSSATPPDTSSASPSSFTLAFAAVADEREARSVAARVRVDGQAPRITPSERNGRTLYRVVMGPFATRADAERLGKASGQSYWIFEGIP